MLISMMSTLTIAGILLSVTAPAIMGMIESRDLDEERGACEALATQLRTSWSIPNPDYNVALFQGAPGIAGAKKASRFDDLKRKNWKKSENQDDPLIKLARMRDRAPNDDDELTGQSRGGTSDIWFNKRRAKRLILVGPTDEPLKQRYLVVSLMVPSHLNLTLPTPTNTVTDEDLFETLWAATWGDPSVRIPAAWNVGDANRNLWNEMNRGRTNASRLVVVRVVQSKYQLTVNNINTSDQKLWVELPALSVNDPNNKVFINDTKTTTTGIAKDIPFSTDALPITSPFRRGIPEGTLVNIWKGTNAGDRVKVRQFFIDKNTSITVE
jgi:hypothetical protein